MKSLQVPVLSTKRARSNVPYLRLNIRACDNEVTVKIEASPINHAILEIMFGLRLIWSSIRPSERNGHPSIMLDVPAPAVRPSPSPPGGEWLPVRSKLVEVLSRPVPS